MAGAQHTCEHEATSEDGTEPGDWIQLDTVPGILGNVAGMPGEVAVVSCEPTMVSSESRMVSAEARMVSPESRMESQGLTPKQVASFPGKAMELSGDAALMLESAGQMSGVMIVLSWLL